MDFMDRLRPYIDTEDRAMQLFLLEVLRDNPGTPGEWGLKLAYNELRAGRITEAAFDLEELQVSGEAAAFLVQDIRENGLNEANGILVQQLPPAQALAYREELSPFLSSGQWSFYELLQDGSREGVREAYYSCLDQLVLDFDFSLYRRAKQLAAVIAGKGWLREHELPAILNQNLNSDWFGLDGILAVYMAGVLGKREYAGLIAGMLVRDGEDLLMEEAADCLVSFQDENTINTVSPYAEQGNVYALSVLGEIKSADAVRELKAMYRNVLPEERELVVEALCRQLNPEAAEEIENAAGGGIESLMVDLELMLYGFYTVLGMEHPMLEKWRSGILSRMIQ
ncbi:hypothetical protein V1498_03470 [Peribacillus sp. SCS-26]|uniref:hypothetical protein n=1 Tax=Paraperibacillus marinus TaxID=3115295 RepID=UPI003906BEF9